MLRPRYPVHLMAAAAVLLVLCLASCKQSTPPTLGYAVTTLVADTAGLGASRIDPNLSNAWGVVAGSTGTFWISSNHGSVSLALDGAGVDKLGFPVTIPSRDSSAGGAPTGVVFNGTPSEFNGSSFIFAGEDGSISAWTGGHGAVREAVDPSPDAVYKGLALASDGGHDFLYAADFKERKIVVFDTHFVPVAGKLFVDPTTSPAIPSDYGPFNIASVGGMLYVTYARHKPPENGDDLAGAGNGYVNVFRPDGSFVRRFASAGALNSPWGVVQAPASFGAYSNAILVGNFGDGRITAFDSTGHELGQLQDASGVALSIDGLWGITFNGAGSNNPHVLYFAAGPQAESHGTFGYVTSP